jgi:hypothetical protein
MEFVHFTTGIRNSGVNFWHGVEFRFKASLDVASFPLPMSSLETEIMTLHLSHMTDNVREGQDEDMALGRQRLTGVLHPGRIPLAGGFGWRRNIGHIVCRA